MVLDITSPDYSKSGQVNKGFSAILRYCSQKRNAVILVGKRETPVSGQMRKRRAAVEWRIFMEEKETVREPYRMVLEGGQAELVEKKSRFIANVRPVESEAEAVAFIDEMKKNTGTPGIIARRLSLARKRS